jgi:hypothetical protein
MGQDRRVPQLPSLILLAGAALLLSSSGLAMSRYVMRRAF